MQPKPSPVTRADIGEQPVPGPAGRLPAVRELEALYRHATLGFGVLDPQARFIRVNDRLAAINGVPAAEHPGRSIAEIVPNLAEQVKAAIAKVVRTGEVLSNVELVGETPAAPGVVRRWREQWFPVSGASGRIEAVGVLVEETTELRRLAEENERFAAALAASQARHAFLVRMYDEMRLEADPVEVAHRACRLLGEHLGLVRAGFAELSEADDTVDVRRPWVKGVPSPEGRYRIEDFGASLLEDLRRGRTRVHPDVANDPLLTPGEKAAHQAWHTHALVVVPVFEDERLRGMFFVNAPTPRAWSEDDLLLIEAVAARAYDAMLRARAVRQVAVSEERARLAQEAARIAVYDYDLVDGTRTWDERIRTLWGLGDDDALTREFLLSFVPPEDVQALDAAIARACDPTGDRTVNVKYRVRRASDARQIWVHATGLVTFEAGRAARLVGTLKDITTLQQAEVALREADQRKDEFLAMLAHELRNPLAPIRNALQVVERCELPQHGRSAVAMADRQLRHMSRLIDDLLEVSRITRGLIQVAPEQLLVQQSIFSVAEALAPTLAERDQQLEFDLPRTALWVRADPVRFSQIVENLLTNASKYSDAGSVIVITARSTDDEVVIEVRDPGIGIEPQHLETVFELFAQVDTTIARSRGGLGIGLALVRKLVEAHGGRVTVSSEGRGRGSVFTVALPMPAPG